VKLSEHPRLSHSASSYAARQRSPRKHLTGIGLVVLLHALLLWAISSGLARQVVRMTENTVEAVLMTEAPPPAPTPPPKTPPPKTPAPPPPAPTSTAPAITQPTAPPAALPAPTAAPAIRTGAVIQPGVNCAPKDEDYPKASRRMEEEGTVTLKFLIGADGRVLQTEIEKSSGFTRLDEASRVVMSKCQFRPGTLDGKPEQSWANIKITWRLER
jgi:periplasmic protein TonB